MADPNPSAVFHPERLNKNVRDAEYAVRGKLFLAAMQRQQEGKPVTLTNVGNPHSLGQKPLTFPRQVLALCTYPALMDDPVVRSRFPSDAIARAKKYLSVIPGGTGAYQDSRGNLAIRKEVAEFIERRDGVPADFENIYLTSGASHGIQLCLKALIRDRKDAVLLPIPQYPLYSATIELCNGTRVGYALDESSGFSLSVAELDRAVAKARRQGTTVRGLVVINPGNPTGSILSADNLREVLKWCRRERVVLFADEVYQTNLYNPAKPFVSFKKALASLGKAGEGTEMISFHTVSKGAWGECGRRGGYMEFTGIHPGAKEQIFKMLSITLSTNVDGQIFVGIMTNPPKPGDESYESHKREEAAIIESLTRRAKMMSEAFNSVPGISCENVDAAMYAFPQIYLPPGAIAAAKKEGMPGDVFYCLELLKETGICAVPGSGFLQAPGTFHFRTTILPQEKEFPGVLQSFKRFHTGFMSKFAGKSKL